MATLTDKATAASPLTATSPDFEPDDQWKDNLRRQIEKNLTSMVEKAQQEYRDKTNNTSLDQTTVEAEHRSAMVQIRRIAEEHYRHAVERERQERLWASGQQVDQSWSEALIKEQQAILDNIKRDSQPQPRVDTSDGANRNKDPVDGPTKAAQRQSTVVAEPVVQERARKPSAASSNFTPSSFEDRESTHMSGTYPSRRNDEPIRDRSSSTGSPPKSRPEIWVPTVASKDGPTSRTLAHASGTFTMKPRRDSSASASTASSIPATIPELNRSSESNLSRSFERDQARAQDPEHGWGGITRSRKKTRKGSSSADDRLPVGQFATDNRRVDEHAVASSPTASIATPVSPYDASRYQAPGTTPSRSPVNPRRSFTEETRPSPSSSNPRIWFPQAQVSEPKPIKSKQPIREEDAGFSFQPSPTSSRWEARESPIEESRPYGSSPQEGIRSRKPASLRSRSSINSLRFKTAQIVNPRVELYPENSEYESEPDDEHEWRQKLEVEFSQRESHAKMMEEEVKRKREEARRKEEELRQKEEAFRLKEKEVLRKEEEFRKKQEEIKRKEEEFRQKEEVVRLKHEEVRRKEQEFRQKEAEAKIKQEEALMKAAETLRKEEEIRRKEEEAVRRAEEVKKQAEEAARLEQEYKQKEREAKRIEEETQKREAEARRKEEEALQKQEEIKQKEEDMKRIEKEAQQRQQEMKRKEDEAKCKEAEAKKQADLTKRRAEEIRKQELKIKKREEQLKKKEKELNLREEEEEVRRARQDSISSETVSLMKEEEIKRKEEELERREADLQRREAEIKLKEEEEAKRRQSEAEDRLREEEARKRELEAAAKLREETEAKEREEKEQEASRQKVAQLEADRREAIRLEGEWRKEDMALRAEEQKIEAERRKAEAETQRQEEAARKREAKFREDQRRADDIRRQQEELRKRDESSRSSGASFSPLGVSPNQTTFADFTPSKSPTTSRSSTWTSSSSSSSRPPSMASSQTSTTSRQTATSTPPARAKTSGWPTGGSSAAGSSSFQNPTSEEEWSRRQAEYAQKQQEQFRKEQERIDREMHARSSKVLSHEDTIKIFHEHERQWARIKTLDELQWESFPWPVFKRPLSKEDLTGAAISAYVLSSYHPTDKSKAPRDRVKDHIKKWHPDRFETKLLTKVKEDEKEKVKEGAGEVARNLNELLSSSLDAFS